MPSNSELLSRLYGEPEYARRRPSEDVAVEELVVMPKKNLMLLRSSKALPDDYYGRHLSALGRSLSGGPVGT